VRALRKAAQRIHDLEQLRAVLSRELIVSGVQATPSLRGERAVKC
jgi:hypothetical protein